MLFTIGSHTINMDNVAYFEIDQHPMNTKADLYVVFIGGEGKVSIMTGSKEDLDMKIVDIKEQMISDI